MQDSDLTTGGGFGWDTPYDPGPTPANALPTYDFLGYDGQTDVYRGNDGQLYQGGQGMNGFVPYTGSATTFSPAPGAPAAAPAPAGPAGTGGSTGTLPGGITSPFTQTFTPPPPVNLGGPEGISYIPPTPTFQGPAFPTIPKFTAPTAEEALNDPGYKFRLQQGTDRLQNAAGAQGILNDSQTLKALTDYGQNAASQEYGNVWNRDYDAYKTDVNNQYILPWTANYQNWSTGVVQPGLLGYSTQAAAGMHANDQNYNNAWNSFLTSWDMFKDQRDSTFDKTFKWATV